MMLDAALASLPIAVGVMVSPLPIVGVVLMLVSGSARANALAFVAAWFVAVCTVVLAAAFLAGAGQDDGAAPAAWTGWLKVVLGALMLVLVVRQGSRGRGRGRRRRRRPGWRRSTSSPPSRQPGSRPCSAG